MFVFLILAQFTFKYLKSENYSERLHYNYIYFDINISYLPLYLEIFNAEQILAFQINCHSIWSLVMKIVMFVFNELLCVIIS